MSTKETERKAQRERLKMFANLKALESVRDNPKSSPAEVLKSVEMILAIIDKKAFLKIAAYS